MYDEKEPKFNIDWPTVIKKILTFVVIIIFVIGIITLIVSCSHNASKNRKTQSNTNVTESETEDSNLDGVMNAMQKAILKYATPDVMPKTVGNIETVRLDYLIKENYTGELKSKDGKTCDRDKTYGVITRLENNYTLKIYADCGSNKDSKTIYIGCFSDCNGSVCKGTKSKKGICNGTSSTSSSESESESTVSQSTSANNNTSSNTNTSNTDNTQTTTKYYEYRKYYTEYSCPNGGTINTQNNRCEINTPATYHGIVQGKGLSYSCDNGGVLQKNRCITSYDPTPKRVYTTTIWSSKPSLGSGYERTGRIK